nr:hypothetical protein [Tanacetum cinerariifolium]
MDDKEEEKKEEEAKVVEDDQVQGRQAKIYKIDMDHASKVLSMQEDKPAEVKEEDEPAEVKEVVDVVTTAKDPEEESTTSLIIPADTKSKDKGKGIMVEEPKHLKKKQQVEMDEEYVRKLHTELNEDIDWDVAVDHVKKKAKEEPTCSEISSYEEKTINRSSSLKKHNHTKEQMEEEESRAIQSINETLAQKASKKRKLNKEVEDLKRHLEIVPDNVYTEATPLARKPNNFSDDFLLTTLGAMFERPDGQAQVWKNQRTVHGQEKVKSWKLLESCMRLKVEEESEMSLELLRFTRQQHQEGQLE